MRYTGPKNKLARRERTDLGLKTVGSKAHSSLLKKINIQPGQHGGSRFRKTSDYGYQLRENQKLKRIYGLTQQQMKRYFQKASAKKGNTAEYLINMLETRLDNVLYRLGFAPTRASSRQLITHGHVIINDKKVTYPSYLVNINDKISFGKSKTIKIPYIATYLDKNELAVPDWLERKAIVGKVKSMPSIDSFKEDIDLQSVIEFYSR